MAELMVLYGYIQQEASLSYPEGPSSGFSKPSFHNAVPNPEVTLDVVII